MPWCESHAMQNDDLETHQERLARTKEIAEGKEKTSVKSKRAVRRALMKAKKQAALGADPSQTSKPKGGFKQDKQDEDLCLLTNRIRGLKCSSSFLEALILHDGYVQPSAGIDEVLLTMSSAYMISSSRKDAALLLLDIYMNKQKNDAKSRNFIWPAILCLCLKRWSDDEWNGLVPKKLCWIRTILWILLQENRARGNVPNWSEQSWRMENQLRREGKGKGKTVRCLSQSRIRTVKSS